MTRSHGMPLPLTLGTDPKKLSDLGFDPRTAGNAEARARYLRNIFADAAAPQAETYQGHPDDHGQPGAATRQMLERLAVHMKYPWPDLFGEGAISDDNEAIPAGYTYLGQLAAHDLVSSIGPLPRLNEFPGYLARDFRSQRLVLDTVYGGGPAAGCLPFALEGTASDQRWQLRLGHVLDREGGTPMDREPARDIPRTSCPHLSDSGRRPRRGVADALIADPRNDDHLILAQLTALFHEFHNFVVTGTRLLQGRGGVLDDFASYRAFLLARKITALVYRRIIVEDFLARLLHPGVHAIYSGLLAAGNADGFLDKSRDNRVPVEFSHAAYRFGHVMVRFFYALNDIFDVNGRGDATIGDVLDRSSARRPERMPVACQWLIDWSRFFELGRTPNHSRSLRPYIAFGSLTNNTYFPNEDGRDGGIFYRDFVRGAEAGMRTAASLIETLRKAGRTLSPLLEDPNYREHAIGRWLSCQDKTLLGSDERHKFSASEAVALSKDPPLLFFVLFEAAHDEKGKRLGILGSTILAEVFFRALLSTLAAIELDAETVAAAETLFEKKIPNSMPMLIRFMQEHGFLHPVACQP